MKTCVTGYRQNVMLRDPKKGYQEADPELVAIARSPSQPGVRGWPGVLQEVPGGPQEKWGIVSLHYFIH